ncbi:MAG: DUF6679 family protein [Cyanobium sp. ELA507]|jgi:hypothetical protein
MLSRKLDQFAADQRPVWIYLRDQQRWIEEALVVEVSDGGVTIRYHEIDGEDHHSWEETVQLASIGAVSTRLASVSTSSEAEDLPTTGECPEAERLGQP